MTGVAVALAGLLVVGTATSYLLPRASVTPMTEASLWLAVLGLRAALILLAALLAVFYLPATEIFQILTHWCLHAVPPFLSTHLGFSGHGVGDAASVLPGLVIAVSATWAAFVVVRAARAVRHLVNRGSLGTGPGESVIVGGEEVLVAAAGIRSPKVVVSTGALAQLDEDELAASLAHERGHIARRHPYFALAGNFAYAVARPIPGSKDALQRLRFFLERDADEYAVNCTSDPMALASAICKAATDSPKPNAALATLAGSGTPARLRLLLDRPAPNSKTWAEVVGRSVVMLMVAGTLLALAMTPSLARAGVTTLEASPPAHSCD